MLKKDETPNEAQVIRNRMMVLEAGWTNPTNGKNISNFTRKKQVKEYDRLNNKLEKITQISNKTH